MRFRKNKSRSARIILGALFELAGVIMFSSGMDNNDIIQAGIGVIVGLVGLVMMLRG